MKKRLLALALAAFLLLPLAGAVMEEEARAENVAQLNQLVEAFLNKYDYQFTMEDDVYTLEFEMDSALRSCKVEIRTYYDAVEVIAAPDISAAEANRENLALLIALLNYRLFYSQLGIRMETGFFYSRGVQLVESVIPGIEELDVLFHLALNDLEEYGDGLAEVALAGSDPYTVYEKMME